MLSIIICSVEDSRFRHICAEYERVLKGSPYEIIRIDDARGMAEGYNRGIKRAKYDLLLFFRTTTSKFWRMILRPSFFPGWRSMI